MGATTLATEVVPAVPGSGAAGRRGPLSAAERAILDPEEVLAGYRIMFDDDGTLTVEHGVIEVPTAEGTVYRWRCTVCGYIHEAPEPPRWCPLCGAEASRFVQEA